MKLDFTDIIFGITFGVAAVFGFFWISTTSEVEKLTAQLNSAKAETAQILTDCSKMGGFVYNYQVHVCKPTGKWTAVEVGKYR